MQPLDLNVTYIGGPTALVEFDGARFLSDPTLDPVGTDYPTPAYTLHKLQSPALDAGRLGRLDGVLLSHDHHFDNLDRAGRSMLAEASVVYTTTAGAERLGRPAVGLTPWDTIEHRAPRGRITITATPARHGPPDGDRGPVIGFVLSSPATPNSAVYLSGDTVWYDGVQEVIRRFDPAVALLNLGAAMVAVAGPAPLTFTAAEAVLFAQASPRSLVVPLHFEGWAHFSEGRREVERAFTAAGLESRLLWLEPGKRTHIP
jgi:L-ascorbate metabolism protein UlaG (beta-lactamase superfamily)